MSTSEASRLRIFYSLTIKFSFIMLYFYFVITFIKWKMIYFFTAPANIALNTRIIFKFFKFNKFNTKNRSDFLGCF